MTANLVELLARSLGHLHHALDGLHRSSDTPPAAAAETASVAARQAAAATAEAHQVALVAARSRADAEWLSGVLDLFEAITEAARTSGAVLQAVAAAQGDEAAEVDRVVSAHGEALAATLDAWAAAVVNAATGPGSTGRRRPVAELVADAGDIQVDTRAATPAGTAVALRLGDHLVALSNAALALMACTSSAPEVVGAAVARWQAEAER